MVKKYRPNRSDQEWFDLITECRQSGLSDKAWCDMHDIPSSTFYNAVGRLRKKACEIPKPTNNKSVMDLTSNKQEVVQIKVVPDEEPEPVIPVCQEMTDMYLDNSHTIEILMNGTTTLRIYNAVDPALLESVIHMIRRAAC